ncbi:MAG: guanylate kinase [Candidatus Cloacimonadota bacterium]|nr:MAG: guanylate kinase [Candidatus Cloacimonadota bacterium]RLC53838.1 MAG: guanylate kinase [Candidatus Cloacimonadota bacterium]
MPIKQLLRIDNTPVSNFEKKSFLIALISPSGGGKTAILRKILEQCDNVTYSISYTTRAPRHNEKNGFDYHFVTEEKFNQMQAEGDFLEHAKVHGCWYGTSRSFVQSELNKGHHIIMDIDVWGAKQIIKQDIDVITIFILPPSEKEQIARLKNRGTECDEAIGTRLETAKKEMAEISNFEYLVINDDFDLAVQKVKQIILAEENKYKRYINIEKNYYGG